MTMSATPHRDALAAFGDLPILPDLPQSLLLDIQSPSSMTRFEQYREDSFSDLLDWNMTVQSPLLSIAENCSSVGTQSQELFPPLEGPMDAEMTVSCGTGMSQQSSARSSHLRDLFCTTLMDKDVESIIPSLQLLEKRFLAARGDRETGFFMEIAGRSRHKLREALNSDWLQDDLNMVIYQAYQTAANKRMKQISRFTDVYDPIYRDSQPNDSPKEIQTVSARKVSSRLAISQSIIYDRELLIAELRNSSSDDENECRIAIDTVTIFYIPELQRSRVGVSCTFQRAVKDGSRIHIPPSIKTFNIVPYDAEIIDLVEKDDLEGVRKLFETGKASPTDIDPSGHSLLSVRRIPRYYP